VLALVSSGPLAAAAGAAEGCRTPGGQEQPPVAHLVSAVGEVSVRGAAQPGARGALPFVPICAGDLVTVGSASRAAVYLIGADTPLRLDEDTVGRIAAPPGPGSGIVELARGAVYFLSQVRRTLTIRTPYVNAGIEGTEVYLRVREPRGPGVRGAELIVLEGRVALTPGAGGGARFAAETAVTGERIEVSVAGPLRRTVLPSPGGAYGALRRVAVGELSWTLFYPDVLTEPEAAAFPRIAEAARLLAAGQAAEAEAVLARVPPGGTETGLRDALLAIVAVARKDPASAGQLAERAVVTAPNSAVPQLASSYARQLATDLDGALAAAETAAGLAPREPLPRARLAEIRLMRGETRQARRAANDAVERGGGPLAQIVLGYAELAALRGARGEAAFRRALQDESWNPLALLGLGLAHIKQGDLAAGTVQVENAVTHDPSSSLLRSYLGEAYFEQRRNLASGKQLAIAKDLDPGDPTPWLFDALRKQLENRPLEALGDLDRSIELNENRAPFRSRLLLDQDAAARGVALSRIYDDLGFEELAVIEAGRSLAFDPASPAAHRFLAEVYANRPRYGIASVSEQLQAQLLQAPTLTPLSPRLALADLAEVARAGPRTVSFNEYTPLFERNGTQVTTVGRVGSDDTRNGEIAATALAGPYAFGVSAFRASNDGARGSDDLDTDAADLFAQAQLTPELGVQAEYWVRDADAGDLAFDLDPDQSPEQRDAQNTNEEFGRIGFHFSPSPNSDLIGYAAVGDRDTSDRLRIEDPSENFRLTNDFDSDETGQEVELQYLWRLDPLSITAGGGYYTFDLRSTNQVIIDRDIIIDRANDDYNQRFAYIKGSVDITPSLLLTLGGEISHVEDTSLGIDETDLHPWLGFSWRPLPGLNVRAAYGQRRKPRLVANQTLVPTNIVGFNQFFDDPNDALARNFSAGVDLAVHNLLGRKRSLYGGIEVIARDLDVPQQDVELDTGEIGTKSTDYNETIFGGYLFGVLNERLAFTFEPSLDLAHCQKGCPRNVKRLSTIAFPFGLRFFHPSGLFASGDVTWLAQDLRTVSRTTDSESFTTIDVAAGYRFPARYGAIALEVRNLFDQSFGYQDNSFRSVGLTQASYAPDRQIWLTVALQF
jgi:Flp pilus assembly protein TadD